MSEFVCACLISIKSHRSDDTDSTPRPANLIPVG